MTVFFWIGWGITVISKIIFCPILLYILCLKSSNMCLKSQKFLFTDLEKLCIELENVYKLNIWLFKKQYQPISTNERRQQGVPFESLYRLKYASLGEIVFFEIKNEVFIGWPWYLRYALFEDGGSLRTFS